MMKLLDKKMRLPNMQLLKLKRRRGSSKRSEELRSTSFSEMQDSWRNG